MLKFNQHDRYVDLALLLMRIALGVVFVYHGIEKIASISKTTEFFSTLGLSAPWAWLVTIVELVGGIAMLVGIGTTIAGLLLAIVMLAAIMIATKSMGFSGGWEYNFVLFLLSLAVAAAGPGRYSLHRFLCKCCYLSTKNTAEF